MLDAICRAVVEEGVYVRVFVNSLDRMCMTKRGRGEIRRGRVCIETLMTRRGSYDRHQFFSDLGDPLLIELELANISASVNYQCRRRRK